MNIPAYPYTHSGVFVHPAGGRRAGGVGGYALKFTSFVGAGWTVVTRGGTWRSGKA